MPTQTATLGALPENTIVASPQLKHVRSQGRWEGQMMTRLAVRDLEPFYTGNRGCAQVATRWFRRDPGPWPHRLRLLLLWTAR